MKLSFLKTTIFFSLLLTKNIGLAMMCSQLFTHEDKMIISNLTELKKTDLPRKTYLKLPQGTSTNEISIFSENNNIAIDRLVLEMHTNKLKHPEVANSPLTTEKITADEGVYLINLTQEEAYKDRMSFLPLEEQVKSMEILKKASEIGDNFKIELSSEVIGFITLRSFEHNGEQKILISWVWAKAELELDTRAMLQISFLQILNQYPNKTLIASVHLKNKRSIGFFNKLGFVPTWLNLE
jgi:hypothetical protein